MSLYPCEKEIRKDGIREQMEGHVLESSKAIGGTLSKIGNNHEILAKIRHNLSYGLETSLHLLC